jgi:hypothetical protein
MPGFIDSRVHLARSGATLPGWDIHHAVRANVAYGIHTVVDLAGPWWVEDLATLGPETAFEAQGRWPASLDIIASGRAFSPPNGTPCAGPVHRFAASCTDVGDQPTLSSRISVSLTESDPVSVEGGPGGFPGDAATRAAGAQVAVVWASGWGPVGLFAAEDTVSEIHLAAPPWDETAANVVASLVDAVVTSLSPLVSAGEVGMGRDPEAPHGSRGTVSGVLTEVKRSWEDALPVGPDAAKFEPSIRAGIQERLDASCAQLMALRVADVDILLGSGAGEPWVPHGLGLHWEMDDYVRCLVLGEMDESAAGLEALIAATSRPAGRYGLPLHRAAVQGGSDRLVVFGSAPDTPTGDGDNLRLSGARDISAVLLGGELVEPEALNAAVGSGNLSTERTGDGGLQADGQTCHADFGCADGLHCDMVDHVCRPACEDNSTCSTDTFCGPINGDPPEDPRIFTLVCRPLGPPCNPIGPNTCDDGFGCIPRGTGRSECVPAGDLDADGAQECSAVEAFGRCNGSRVCDSEHFCRTVCSQQSDCDRGTCAIETLEGDWGTCRE